MKLKPIVAFASVALVSASVSVFAASTGMSAKDKISYTLGADMGMNFKKNNIEVNPEVLAEGLKAGLSGQNLKLTKKEMEQTLINFQKGLQAKRQQEFKSIAAKNEKDGQAFLKKNKSQKGVVTLPDGLQYKILTPGNGPKPSASDIVTVNYQGSFINGKVFDSSYKRGQPTTFPLKQVIKGWQEVLPMMKTGATWEAYVPAKLAYGSEGIGGVIGPNQTLVFKINLISIKGKK